MKWQRDVRFIFRKQNSDFSVYLPLIFLCLIHFAEYNVVCKYMYN